MPSVWSWSKLQRFRDRHYSSPITANDFYDIFSLSNALPYCDIVVCDKFYANSCKTTELDTSCNTKVTYRLEDLSSLL